MPTDPVCGMFVPDTSRLKYTDEGNTYYFCSRDCLERFSNPGKQSADLRNRLLIGVIFAIPVLIITYVVHASYFRDLILLLLAAPVQFYSGSVFYRGSVHSLRERTANMDILITLGSTTAYVFSAFVSIVHISGTGPGEVYFDASSAIVTLILVGQYLESRSKMKSDMTARGLLDLLPDRIHIVTGDEVNDRDFSDVRPGDTVRILPGERIPCDGTVLKGSTEVDESIISGEQKPTLKTAGDTVISGSLSLNGSIDVRVEAIGKGSSIDEINGLISRAGMGRTSYQRISDRFSSLFVPVIILSASVTAVSWYVFLSLVGYPSPILISVLAFVSVVVIACPCAIGLATPISLIVASDTALSSGTIIRNPGSIERLSKIDTVILDKTGTITEASPAISEIVCNGMKENELLTLAMSVESYSTHPYAKALISECLKRGLKAIPATEIHETPGVGISGICNGLKVEIMADRRSDASGFSVFIDGIERGSMKLAYNLKEGAVEGIKRLHEYGIGVHIVSGDTEEEVRKVFSSTGADSYISRSSPEKKERVVREAQEKGHYVLFLGDGINDAAAIASADVGCTVSDGTDIAKARSDIVFLSGNVDSIFSAIIIARSTVRKIRQNIIYAIAYNVALVPVAAGVFVPLFGLIIFSYLPFLSAIAMGFSSTSVVLNSLRLRKTIRSKLPASLLAAVS